MLVCVLDAALDATFSFLEYALGDFGIAFGLKAMFDQTTNRSQMVGKHLMNSSECIDLILRLLRHGIEQLSYQALQRFVSLPGYFE